MIDSEKLKKESVDRCKVLIDELNFEDLSKVVLGFLENPKEMDDFIKCLLAFAMFLKFSKRMEEYTLILQAATTLSIEQSLFNQFQSEMKTFSPRN